MRIDMNKVLSRAEEEESAIASINIYDSLSITGALSASEATERSIILAFSPRYQKYTSIQEIAFMTEHCEQIAVEPYVLHLDHCSDETEIMTALKHGFTSVMFDGSMLPFEENIRRTKEVAKKAHDCGASIEAELGAIKTGENAAEDTGIYQQYTDPEKAAEFVHETNIDALAVSVGTVHGLYTAKPNIRFDILDQIHETVQVPLVLHGGSDLGVEILQKTIMHGIRKVNINTDISRWCVKCVSEAINRNSNIHLSEIDNIALKAFTDISKAYIHILSMKQPDKKEKIYEYIN